MNPTRALLLSAALTTSTAFASDPGRPVPVSIMAEPSVRPIGAPRYSDVSFSSRARRDGEPHDTFRSAAAFHATRLDWVYNQDSNWIALCRGKGYAFNGTLSSATVEGSTPEERERGRIRDRAGQLVTAPWMLNFPRIPWWGCVNSPEYREAYLLQARRMIDAGVDSIQMDDPGVNYPAVAWGGCWCAHCQDKARAAGVDLEADMKAFQRQSVSEFYRDMHTELRAYAKRPISFSANNYDGRSLGEFPHDPFDFGIAELPAKSAQPETIYNRILDARRLGKAQIFTLVSEDEHLTRQVIATTYAAGGHLIAPWDVFNPGKPRIYAEPEQYADLFGFARGIARWLDGYEDGVMPLSGPQPFPDAGLPVRVAGKKGTDVHAFVRAIPGDTNAPVVVHLVDWSENPHPTSLSIDPIRFFGNQPVLYRLLTPAPYDEQAHSTAEKLKDYNPLVQETILGSGVRDTIELPALKPWGVLVVERDDSATEDVYPPTLVPPGGDFVVERTIRIYSADEDGEIRYTIDGAEPNETSPRYEQPFVITSDHTIKARAYRDGRGSAVKTTAFRNVGGLVPALVDRAALTPGVAYSYYENPAVTAEIPHQPGGWMALPDFPNFTPVERGAMPVPVIEDSRRDFEFAYVFKGFIDAPEHGFYTFAAHADDGLRISVGGHEVLEANRAGVHYKEGIVALQAGLHPIRIEYYEGFGNERLSILWKANHGLLKPLSADALFHQSSP
ncbi:MAG TPA: FN3 associated domain-containing protein [Kiritimatiellia bacterium]|nr:FN3 associated domain-containing protein [Kiritimatiellia bacterium]